MKKVAAFCRVIDIVCEWTGKGASLLLIPLALILVYEVIMRYVFNKPTVFAQETSVYLYGFIGMIAGGWVLLHEEHVKMDAIYGRLSSRTKAILDIITAPLFFYFCFIVLWEGYGMAYRSVKVLEHSFSAWAPPYYPVKVIIPVATLLLLLEGISKFRRDFISARRQK